MITLRELQFSQRKPNLRQGSIETYWWYDNKLR